MKGLIASGWQKGCRNPQEIDKLLQFCRDSGITDLFFHVFMRGTALHKSGFLQKYDFGGLNELGEKKHPSDFDALQYLLDNAGDIKIHAYLTMLELGTTTADLFYKDWLMESGWGVPHFDPTVPDARKFLITVCTEIAQNYPKLAGMYFEKMRYPTRVAGRGTENQRKEGVLALIEGISSAVKSINPNLILSYCANLSRFNEANVIFYEMVDWRDLLARGVIDHFCPTLFRPEELEAEFDAWIAKLDPATTTPIVGACDIDLKTTMLRIDKLRQAGFGYIIYSYGHFSAWGEKRTDFKDKLCQR